MKQIDMRASTSKGSSIYDQRAKCVKCGKEFMHNTLWLYKVVDKNSTKHKTKYMCSYSCWKAYKEEHPIKKKN